MHENWSHSMLFSLTLTVRIFLLILQNNSSNSILAIVLGFFVNNIVGSWEFAKILRFNDFMLFETRGMRTSAISSRIFGVLI